MNRLMKIGISVVLIMVSLVALGGLYQSRQSAQDAKTYPAPGDHYDVDGLSLHLDCRGQGSPTVVLEAGLTSGSLSWSMVHDALAEQTRVCAYDRPGIDWSEPKIGLIDAVKVSDRLAKLLATAKINDDKILIGMSAGGVYVREFYRRHPEKIVAMVLIDSSHEQQANRLPAVNAAGLEASLNACRYLQPIGVIRLFSLLEPIIDVLQLPSEFKAPYLASLNQSHACSAIYWETQSFALEVQDELAPNSLGDLPLLVLSQGNPPKANDSYGFSLQDAQAQRKVWNQLQIELSQLSTNGQRFVAQRSGHVIQFEQPELVIDKVNALVANLRLAAKP